MKKKYFPPKQIVEKTKCSILLCSSSLKTKASSFVKQQNAVLPFTTQIRKDRVNVIVELAFLLHDSYIMILDCERDQTLITDIREARMNISKLIEIASSRGKKVDTLLDTMMELSKVVNDEDLLLRVEENGDNESFTAEMTFFRE